MKSYFIFPLLLQKFIWIPTRLALAIFGRIKIRGLENLEGLKKPLIFASNHSSEIDPFIVPACLPFWSRFSPIFYAVREKSFYEENGWRKHLFGGNFIRAWGGHGVKVGLKDYEKALETHLKIINEGGSFSIFPEGGITRDGNIQEGKGGVTYMAEKSGAPIVPVYVSGVYGMSMTDFFTRKRKISVTFGKPIFQDELKRETSKSSTVEQNIYKAEAGYVMRRIKMLA